MLYNFKKFKSGQASVEIAVIMGILLLAFLIFFAVNSDIRSTFNSRYSTDKITVALEDIVSASEIVYAQGSGAKKTVFISLPNSVFGSDVSGTTFTFYTYADSYSDDPYPVYRVVDFNVGGFLPASQGNYEIVVESFGGGVNVSFT